MTKEEQEQLTQIHNKLVKDKHTIEHLTAEVTRLREALEKIAFPLTYLQREADKTGSKLNGVYANHLIQTVHHWREIAKQALTEKTE